MTLISQRVERDSFPVLIKKIITRRRQPLEKFTASGLRFTNVQPNINAINQFKAMFLCNELPVSYMFILAFRYIAQLLVSSEISSQLIGMIHLNSRFCIITPHDWLQPTEIDVRIISCSANKKGITYLLSTHFYQRGQLTLINENHFFSKSVNYRSGKRTIDTKIPHVKIIAKKQFTSNIARQYAKVSGDYNPIHLHSLMAKMLGVKSAVMHGMYGLHWLLTQEDIVNLAIKKSIEVQFNRPCYLPTAVLLTKYHDKNSYALFSENLDDRFMKINFT